MDPLASDAALHAQDALCALHPDAEAMTLPLGMEDAVCRMIAPKHVVQTTARVSDVVETIHNIWRSIPKVTSIIHDGLSHDQADLVKVILKAAVVTVLPPGMVLPAREICAKMCWDSIGKNLVALSLPRRFGKTHAVCVIAAAILYWVPNMKIIVIAQNMEMAKKNLGMIRMGFKQLVEIYGQLSTGTRVDDKPKDAVNAFRVAVSSEDSRSIFCFSNAVG